MRYFNFVSGWQRICKASGIADMYRQPAYLTSGRPAAAASLLLVSKDILKKLKSVIVKYRHEHK